ncbi:energy-coupling factor transporter transmembrane component T family protein [Pseudobacteroides cellulosolvens]|uniref:ABC-type transporter, integral membrane subunit n=1 Tax=Pseudobacteroides cellulosolvens ATCC 35603 = DSM 2933 TaxID=398512 RepID=A0A0L6JN90_9FIRM|nr:energy-coupling factor transporter transmembrane component T [Pseudobacteroides cellulosolvens]KNY27234.1 ABC-type transporter, integral membrane subunit [Pseudobacteroides cellulosolvens ATCC 35603 = DSM 2933]
MIKNITLGQYVQGNTLLHRADPRTKIILTFVLMIYFVIINSYIQFGLAVFFTVIVLAGTKVHISYVIKSIKPIFLIMMITGIINLIATKGTTALEIGFVRITYEGIGITVKMILRLSLIIINSSMITYTTTPITVTDALESLLAGLKRFRVPVHEVAMMVSLSIRFIPILVEETDKLMKAQASRGAEFDQGGIIKRAKGYIPLMIPLLAGAFRRAEELAMAMEARCYRGGEGRTRLKQLKYSKDDIKVSVLFLVFIICAIAVYLVTK